MELESPPLNSRSLIYLSFRIRFSGGAPFFRVLCERVGTFSRSRRESAFPSFSAAYFSHAAQANLIYSPSERLAREGPSDSTFRAMSHFPHFSSAGAEYFSPARERWLEISHDRVLQGRHNHVLSLRFRLFFAKAGRQSSPRPSLPKRRDLCPPARFALKGHRLQPCRQSAFCLFPSERLAREELPPNSPGAPGSRPFCGRKPGLRKHSHDT